MTTRLRITIADDHPVCRYAVRDYLSRSPDLQVVAELARGADLETVVVQHCPDLLILDLHMEPGFDPAAAVPRLRQRHPELKVVVFSARDQAAWVRAMLEARVDGYVHKSEPLEVLLQAVRAATRGDHYFSHHLLQRVADGYWHNQTLAPHERQLLQALANGRTLREAAIELLHVSERTARDYLAEAMHKLEARSRVEVVVKALRLGLIE